ncbi:MAG: sensor histidine kinase, partial [Candidatus Sericytochromatia bacterium]
GTAGLVPVPRGDGETVNLIFTAPLEFLITKMKLAAFGAVRWTLLWGLDEANRHLAMPVVTALTVPGATVAEARRVIASLPVAADERLELLGADARPIAGRGAGLAGMPLVPGVATWEGDEAFRALTVRVDAGRLGIVYVRAAHVATRPHQALLTLAVVLAVSLPMALLLAWAIADRLAARAAAPVEAALDRERQFLRDVSHELRTPLAALLGQLGLAAVGEPDDSRARVRQAEAIARRMGAVVSDLLALSREDAGAALRIEPFDLEDLLEQELALVRGLAQARGVTIALGPMPVDADAVGDAERIARAVRNLLENAVWYAPAGGHVSAGIEREANAVRLRIGNDGPPIGPGERERLFDRFYRGTAGRAARPEGTGLGLAISRAVARAHGGDLVLTSGPDESPAFTLTLPLVARPARG